MRGLPWLATAVMLNASPAAGQLVSAVSLSPGDTATINVTGVGEVLVSPTRAIVFIAITAQSSTAGTAVSANAELRSKVVQALAEAGFGEGHVVPWGYGAGPATPRGRAVGPGQPVLDPAFEAKAGIRVVVEPVSRLEEVVSVALLAGADGIPLVRFETGDAEVAQREAAKIAVAKARTSAEAIAEAAGGSLGALRHLTTLPDYNTVINASRFLSSSMPGQGVQLTPTEVSVTVQVQASWVFIPR